MLDVEDAVFILRLMYEGGVGEGDKWEEKRLNILNKLKDKGFCEELRDLPARDGGWIVIKRYEGRKYDEELCIYDSFILRWVMLDDRLKKEFEGRLEKIRHPYTLKNEDVSDAGFIACVWPNVRRNIARFLITKFGDKNYMHVWESIPEALGRIGLHEPKLGEYIIYFLLKRLGDKKYKNVWSRIPWAVSLASIGAEWEFKENLINFLLERYENENNENIMEYILETLELIAEVDEYITHYILESIKRKIETGIMDERHMNLVIPLIDTLESIWLRWDHVKADFWEFVFSGEEVLKHED